MGWHHTNKPLAGLDTPFLGLCNALTWGQMGVTGGWGTVLRSWVGESGRNESYA